MPEDVFNSIVQSLDSGEQPASPNEECMEDDGFIVETEPVRNIFSLLFPKLYGRFSKGQTTVYGKWLTQLDGTHYCSHCGRDATYNYDGREIAGICCCYCGAIMKRR